MSLLDWYKSLVEKGKEGSWGLQPSKGNTSKIVEAYIKNVLWTDQPVFMAKVGKKEIAEAMNWFKSMTKEEQKKALDAANVTLADVDGARLSEGKEESEDEYTDFEEL